MPLAWISRSAMAAIGGARPASFASARMIAKDWA